MSSKEAPKKVGPYRLEERLGAGGMGEVYRAFDERLHRRVALKHIRPDKAENPKAKDRFLREARVAARLNHPVLVHIHDILEHEGGLWIVMELLEGERLDRLIKEGPLPLGRGLSLARDITAGLSAIHAAGILHRDLKTENIMVVPGQDGRTEKARILDFGLAKSSEQDVSISATGGVLGTPRAMSPEQAQGEKTGPPSDLFALGVLLYEIFTGTSPFLGPGPLETIAKVCHYEQDPAVDLVPDLPRELSDLIDRLLAKDPTVRPGHADDVEKVLDAVFRAIGGTPSGSPSRSAPQRRSAAGGDSESFQRIGERRRLTVLCCEMVADTGAVDGVHSSGSLDPELLFEVLPRFQALIHRVIEKYGGFLGDFQGHRLVLYLGYPQAYEDNVRRAVLTGLELVQKGRELNVELEEGTPGLALRAGVHTGPAVVLTPSGSGQRLALGKTLDIAQAVQEAAPAGELFVSGAARALVAGFFEDREAPELSLGAESEPIRVFQTLSAFNIHSPLETASGLSAPIGRDRELDLLVDRLRVAKEGAGQVVLLTGRAGMGKTHLVGALRERLAEENIRWLSTFGSPFYRHTDLRSMAILLSNWLASEAADGYPLELPAALELYELEPEEVGPVLEPVLQLLSDPERGLDREDRRDAVELLPELLAELSELPLLSQGAAGERAMVLIFECLQWMDAGSLEVVGRLIEQIAGSPILLILTCRPDFQSPWGHRSHLTQLHLSALDQEQSESLVDGMLATGDLSAEAKASLSALAGGNPFYLKALTESSDELPTSSQERRSIPDVLQDELAARLDRLGTAKDVAQLAAVQADAFSFQDLLYLWPLDRLSLEYEIERLLEDGTLTRTGPDRRFSFSDPLLKIACLNTLLEEDRLRLEQLAQQGSQDVTLDR